NARHCQSPYVATTFQSVDLHQVFHEWMDVTS
ncbi:hypothetical protein GBF38_005944, partial [Nibea albiflora]